ncbi:MAG: hypothetical protein PHT02_00735 [Tissierellia bacterium]|nr:hypothetical protein [Tissierellia bacterium]
MKFNFTVDIEDCDSVYSLQDEIIYKSSEVLINQLLGNTYDRTDLGEKLENIMIEKLESLMDLDFKKEVAKKVTDNLANRFEKTMQYKTLKADGEVITDAIIKTGLKDLIADMVKSEMKKVFQ